MAEHAGASAEIGFFVLVQLSGQGFSVRGERRGGKR